MECRANLVIVNKPKVEFIVKAAKIGIETTDTKLRDFCKLVVDGTTPPLVLDMQWEKKQRGKKWMALQYCSLSDLFRNEVQKSRGARASAHENLRLSAQARKKRNSCGVVGDLKKMIRKMGAWKLNYKGHHGHLLYHIHHHLILIHFRHEFQ